jgi:hypothetical protein
MFSSLVPAAEAVAPGHPGTVGRIGISIKKKVQTNIYMLVMKLPRRLAGSDPGPPMGRKHIRYRF